MRIIDLPTYFIIRLLKKTQSFLQQSDFLGDYSSWEEAAKVSTGYDAQFILEKVLDATQRVINGEKIYERDSVLFDKIEYSWPVLSALLWIASKNENKLNLIDFGGAFGSSYYQNINFLSDLKEIRWNIVEQDKFVEFGKHRFENEHVTFYSDLSECYSSEQPQAILCSSVIQYLKDPHSFIEVVKSLGFKYVIFDRTPFILEGADRITVQKVPPEIYNATIPIWILNENNFLSQLRRCYKLLAEFASVDGMMIHAKRKVYFKGQIFERI